MKLRIRSMATKETLRVNAPDTSSLRALKTLIAGKLSSSSSSSPPIDPESIHLSLNRKDELFAPSSSAAADSLPSLGLTSGDLLFYSLSPFSQTLAPPNPPNSDSVGRVQTLGSKLVDRIEVDADGTDGTLDSNPEGRMEVDPEPSAAVKKPSLVPRILKGVMDSEKGENEGILGRLVITIHAAFLDSGFLIGQGGDGPRLPPNWASDASNLSIQYTLRDLVDRMEEKDAKFSIVKCSVMGNFITVYGYLSVEHPDVYRVCIDASKVAPFLSLAINLMSEREEKEVLKLWNMVKDGLCLPLLIDICSKNGLPLPPCFMRLSRDLKTDILELVSGVDLARIACTCSEMSAICSDDKLWKKKFEKEFGSSSGAGVQGMRWRERFAAAWIEKKDSSKMSNRRVIRFGVLTDRRFNPARPIFPARPHRYPIIGGDYDLYPAIGNLSPQGAGLRNSRNPARQQFSPHCNLGGGFSRGGFC